MEKYVIVALIAVGIISFKMGKKVGHVDGLEACPAHQERLVAEAESTRQWWVAREAEAELVSKRIKVCDAVAKEEWVQDVVDNLCFDYCSDAAAAGDYGRQGFGDRW